MKLPFNPRNPKTQVMVGIVLALLLAGAATTCRSAEPVLQFGIGSAIIRGEAPVIDLAIVYPQAGPGDADYLFGVTLIGESELYGQAQRNQVAWRAGIVEGFGRFDVGIGLAVLQNADVYNSCRLQFALSLGYRPRRWPVSLGLQHLSNSGSCYPNKGRDALLVAWRFGDRP